MLDEMTEGIATVRGVDLYYKTVGGQNETLLMIMGLSFSHMDWGDRIIESLSRDFQLILFDNRDSGRSSKTSWPYSIEQMADDAFGLLDALNVNTTHVFGVSMGGMIAQHLALKYPAKVGKLILGCTAADTKGLGGFSLDLFSQPVSHLLFTPQYLQSNQADIETFLEAVAPYHSGPIALLRQLYALRTHNVKQSLEQITAETLVITGDRDTVIPSLKSHEIAEGIPRANLDIIPDAAHGFTFSHPDETYALIHSFLQ